MREPLSSDVHISGQFTRSVRLDADFGRSDAMDGYVLQPSAKHVLDATARHILESQQRAFTWTGPYGGGKSSLALALASFAGGTEEIRAKGKKALRIRANEATAKVFGPDLPWKILPVVGRRSSIRAALIDILEQNKIKVAGQSNSSKDVIRGLLRLAQSRHYAGALLLIDELGKFLEFAAAHDDDVYFYQELAEAASRSSGQLVIIGILHQSFEQYGTRLGLGAREEWAKVQGRFVDLPLLAASDETLALIGRAIQIRPGVTQPRSQKIDAGIVADVIRRRRPASPGSLEDALTACWPLHPATAALLGPSSKRKFGQNERSIFGFLASAETYGFQEFLAGTPVGGETYRTAAYWDYLRANFEGAILASADGHRWALGMDAVERAEAKFSKLHIDAVKTVALVDLFKNGSGIAAEEALVASCLGISNVQATELLRELSEASILVFRRHLLAWSVYAGSDFDIAAAVSQANSELGEIDLRRLDSFADLNPITARRHYWQKGAMRWFGRAIMGLSNVPKTSKGSGLVPEGACGQFVLLMPERGKSTVQFAQEVAALSERADLDRVAFGVSRNAPKILELAEDVEALLHVRKARSEIDGDPVARREVEARISAARGQLVDELRTAFSQATWYWRGHEKILDVQRGLSPLASTMADAIFANTPLLASELVNRDELSSSATKARRDLMHRMLRNELDPKLGYTGFPADAGLYYTILARLGLHREGDAGWKFYGPDCSDAGKSLVSLWIATQQLLSEANQPVRLTDLYALWSAAPYGLKRGVRPVIATAFFLTHRSQLALYVDGVFTPELNDADLDEWLQDSDRISWRHVSIQDDAVSMLQDLASMLNEKLGREVSPDALDTARGLVALIYQLPEWTKRTSTLSESAQKFRNLLLKASDPHKVLFVDLPTTLGICADRELAKRIVELTSEITDAYPRMLEDVVGRVLSCLDHSGDLVELRGRAKVVSGISGDFRLDAFAARLSTFVGAQDDIEGLIMLALNKTGAQWNDREIDSAVLTLGAWGLQFRRVEAMAEVRDRPASRQAIAVVFGANDANGARTVSGTFDVADADRSHVDHFVKDLLAKVTAREMKREVLLAALAETGARLVEDRQFGGAQNG